MEIPDYISEVVMPVDPFVKVALLLPFSAKDYPVFVDTLVEKMPVQISARSEQFISFYEGVLLAVDSLKNQGYKVNLKVSIPNGVQRKCILWSMKSTGFIPT